MSAQSTSTPPPPPSGTAVPNPDYNPQAVAASVPTPPPPPSGVAVPNPDYTPKVVPVNLGTMANAVPDKPQPDTAFHKAVEAYIASNPAPNPDIEDRRNGIQPVRLGTAVDTMKDIPSWIPLASSSLAGKDNR